MNDLIEKLIDQWIAQDKPSFSIRLTKTISIQSAKIYDGVSSNNRGIGLYERISKDYMIGWLYLNGKNNYMINYIKAVLRDPDYVLSATKQLKEFLINRVGNFCPCKCTL